MLRGEGRFATVLEASTTGTHVLKLTNVSRWHVKDPAIDAGNQKDAAVILGDTAASGGHMFESVHLRGAKVDTLRLGQSGQGYDVSDNAFLGCRIDSWGPPGSQVVIAGSNTSQNTFAFGSIGLNGGGGGMTRPAVNVKVEDGRNDFISLNWGGASSYDVEAGGARWW